MTQSNLPYAVHVLWHSGQLMTEEIIAHCPTESIAIHFAKLWNGLKHVTVRVVDPNGEIIFTVDDAGNESRFRT